MKQITSREIILELLTERGAGLPIASGGLRAKEKKTKRISNRKI